MPTDGPLAGWSAIGDGTATADEAVRLLVALGAATGRAGRGLQLIAPDGTANAVASGEGDSERDWAESGATWLTGRRDGAPLLPAGSVASRAGGALLAVRLLSRWLGHDLDIDGRYLLGERAAIAGLRRRGPSSPGGGTRLLAAADGAVGFTLAREHDIASIPALVGRDRVGDPWAALARWVADRPAEVVVARAELLGMPAASLPAEPVPSVPAFRLESLGVRRSVPAVGPLVVDLTSMWAGPLAAHLLGLAGCRVVKVELNGRPDGARRGPTEFYDLLHHGHGALELDLRAADGRTRLRDLLGAADLVLESARPRAFRQLGIAAPDGGGSWVAVRAYDASGRWAERPGFGDDVAIGAGLAVSTPNGRLLPVGDAIADPVAGACAGAAALATLVGGGRWKVETSLAQALSGATAVSAGRPAIRVRGRWMVETAGGRVDVLRPTARSAVGPAAASGADNARFDALLAC